MAAPGQPAVVVHFKSARRRPSAAEIAIQAPGAGRKRPVSKAEVVEDEAGERRPPRTAGTAHAEITLGAGPFVKIKPGKNAASVEVRADARYVALPDFFADDVVFDPVKFTAATLSVPAENFLLQFIEGGDSMVMCIWPGNLKLPARGGAAASARQVAKDGPDPQVDLVFAGEGKARRVSATRIEFQNKPVYVGILEHKGIWHDEDVARLAGLQAHAHRLETALRGPLAGRLHRGRGQEHGGLAHPQPVLRVSEYQQSADRSLVGARHRRDGCAFRRRHEQCKPEEVVGARRRKRPADLARVARQLLHLSGRVQRRRGSFVPLCRQGQEECGRTGKASKNAAATLRRMSTSGSSSIRSAGSRPRR